MARSFASGLVWGLVVSAAGLALISQLAPLPKGVVDHPQTTSSGPATTQNDAGAQAGGVVEQAAPSAPAAAALPTAAGQGNAVQAQASGQMAGSASAPTVADAAPVAGSGSVKMPDTTPGASSAAMPSTLQASGSAAPTAPGTAGVAADPAVVAGTDAGKTALDAPTAEPAAPAATEPATTGPSTPTDAGQGGTAADDQTTAAPVAKPAGDAAQNDIPAVPAPDAATQPQTAPASSTASSATVAPSADAAQADAAGDTGSGTVAANSPAAPSAVTAGQDQATTQPETPEVPTSMAQVPALAPPQQAPATSEAPPALSSLDAALTAPAPDQGPAVAMAPAPDPLGSKDALLVPSQGAGLAEPSRLPQIAAAEDPGLAPAPLPVVTAPDGGDSAPDAAKAVAPRVITPDAPQLPGIKALDSTLPTVLKPSVPGVQTNTLPHIGDTPKGAEAPAAPVADQPIVKYARSFDNAAGKPLFVILLQDVGGAGMNRADLAKLPFPVTFVIDPLATDAKEAAKAYRDAGQEVLMLANGLPAGATASDVAQSFQTLQDILPEAVGVMDEDTAGFQDNRALATLVLPVIADQGRGLVTYDRGLNAADQIARRDGLPAAVIYRRLDGAGESQPVMRRYLDRAAFKAAQEGSVVVLGDTRADTVATILQWTIEGKASGVALAPVTAVMARK